MSRNVVLIILDCVRKDYFDRLAPRLQNLADTSFEQCRAASTWSPPSHASLLTGEMPHQIGIHSGPRDVPDSPRDFSKIDPDALFYNDLPDYTSLAVNANPAIGRFGFGTLFDEYVENFVYRGSNRFPEGLDWNEWESDSSDTNQWVQGVKALLSHDYPLKSIGNWLSVQIKNACAERPIPQLLDDGASTTSRETIKLVERTEEPFFLFINYLDAHSEYQNLLAYDQTIHSVRNSWISDVATEFEIIFKESIEGHEEYVQNRRDIYAAAVEYLDRNVSTLVERLNRITDNETTTIVTSDHGDNLGYSAGNNLMHHKCSMSEGLLHVPFVVINPPDGYDIKETGYFSQVDFPTLARGFIDETTPDVFRNRIAAERIGSLTQFQFERWANDSGYEPDDVAKEHAYLDRMMRCVYEDDSKYQWDSLGNSHRYELDSGRPSWQRHLVDDVEIPEWAFEMFDTDIDSYKQLVEQIGDSGIEEAPEGQLQALGYV